MFSPGCVDDDLPPLAVQLGVVAQFSVVDAVDKRVLAHAHVEVGVGEPRDGLVHVGHRPQRYLGVEVVREVLHKVGFDRELRGGSRRISIIRTTMRRTSLQVQDCINKRAMAL